MKEAILSHEILMFSCNISVLLLLVDKAVNWLMNFFSHENME